MLSKVAGKTVSLIVGHRRLISATAASRPLSAWARWTARRSAVVVMLHITVVDHSTGRQSWSSSRAETPTVITWLGSTSAANWT